MTTPIAKRFLLLPDMHGQDADTAAVLVAAAFKADFKPHVTIFMGDLINADAVSQFPTDAPVALSDEFLAANQLLDMFKPQIVLEGNHEERLRRPGLVREELREMFNVKNLYNIKKRRITWVPYDNDPMVGSYPLGNLRVLHGFWSNIYAARQHAEAYGCCAFGHTHRIQRFQSKMTFDGHVGYNIGCLCRLDLAYTRAHTPRGWMRGFAFGYVRRDGSFDIYQVELVGSRVTINNVTYKILT